MAWGKNKSPNYATLLGGAERDRTVDLLNAIQALSQLSYSPVSDAAETRSLASGPQPGKARRASGKATGQGRG